MTSKERDEDSESARITVIVPVRNEAKKISRCLEALQAQSYPPHEIIVVDGHSTDKTVEIAMRYPVKVLYENIGTRAGANQIGIKQAKGDFIAFTDADCRPEKDWLKNLIREFDDGIAGVGGVVRNIGNSAWENSINMAMETFLGSAQSVQGRVYETKKTVSSISGCNCMYRKEDLVRVGGFDLNLPTAEDTELNRRMRKIGTLVYTPDAIINHNHTRGLKEFAKRTYQYGYGKGKCLIRDLQLIPPIAAAVMPFLLLISLWAFALMLLLYLAVLLVFTTIACWKGKKPEYFPRIMAVYIVEHIAYTVGLWKGLFAFVADRLRESRRSVKQAQSG